MELLEALLAQRAYRSLRPDPVPDDLILRVLEAATHAPSAENAQPWVFIVVTDAGLRAEIGGMTARMWAAAGREYSKPHLPPRMFAEVDRWATTGLAVAPVHIVVCGDTQLVPAPLLASSIFPAVQNLLLAALAVGLGSLLSTLPLISPDEFASLLGLPSHMVPMALVPVGYPERPLGPGRRIEVQDKMFRDRWRPPAS